ncbi:hypothetical protein HG530_015810 [Fusarium avenaceum]|nr:hypothetical protein HG530_015810 [Fusarium avenaceum]
MAAHKLVALLEGLLRKSLDVLVPRHHGVMTFSTEHPSVSPMHAARLATLEDELVRGASFVRVRSDFLFWKIKRHNRGLRLIRGLEFVKMCGRKHGNWAISQLANEAVGVIGFALENASIGIVKPDAIFDFLDLLLKITSQSSESKNHIFFNIFGLVGLENGVFIVRS